jgi:hypothetical protein
VLIGGPAVAAWLSYTGFDAQWGRHWRFYAGIGVFNSALPFWFFSFPVGLLDYTLSLPCDTHCGAGFA